MRHPTFGPAPKLVKDTSLLVMTVMMRLQAAVAAKDAQAAKQETDLTQLRQQVDELQGQTVQAGRKCRPC